jgi:hypothetical protein
LIVAKGLALGGIIRKLFEPFISLMTKEDRSRKVDEANNQKQDPSRALICYFVVVFDAILVEKYSRIS